jgi:hypothetical protein
MAQAGYMVEAEARRSNAAISILWIGLVAGTLDITENLLYNATRNVTPAMVFRYIAGGLVGGQEALKLGGAAIALGVVIHFCIAITWTAIFYVASGKIPALVKHAVMSGLAYGVVVYLVMNFVVLPLTRVPPRRAPTLVSVVNALLPLLLCIGLGISLLVRYVRLKEEARATA